MEVVDEFSDLFEILPEHLGEEFIMDENTDFDAIYAQKLFEEEQKIFEMEEADAILAKKLYDEELATQMQAEEQRKNKPPPPPSQAQTDDATYAKLLQLQEEAILEEEKANAARKDRLLAQQLLDEEYARKLQTELEQSSHIEADYLLAKKLHEDPDAEYARRLADDGEMINSDMEIARQLAQDEEDEIKRAEEAKRMKLLEEEKRRSEQEARRIKEEEERRIAGEIAREETEKALQMEKMDPESSKLIPDTGLLKNTLIKYHGCKIQRIIKPDLRKRFEALLSEYKSKYGNHSPFIKPVWAYHGTKAIRMPSIEEKGLLVPGTNGVTHATDSGWYGRGIYLSPNCDVSLGYSDDGRLLICAVLMGKIFKCHNRLDGAGIQPNCDSHESPGGDEYIVFNPGQVLPVFVIDTRARTNYPLAAPPSYQPYPHFSFKKKHY
jgi:hypothetical protein